MELTAEVPVESLFTNSEGAIMDIASLEDLMQQRGISRGVIKKMSASTMALPPQGILDSWSAAPAIAGLTPAESELLLIRMLERVAAAFGASLGEADVPELSRLPDIDYLLNKISSEKVARLLRQECARLTPTNERCHERV
ncbi:hypothetical protein GTP38_18310 [Duganella sp. FT94W]|uniref:Uncharacterized protein n=1 Tax=Duganella lactea TaxID=2692173 RepID=A0ABW9V9G2_9BURK|nr:hypothetical protein [Duganella lactea]MYM36289.1 hypothetical protein [Duganella lactea]